MGRGSIYDVPGNLPPEERKKYRNKLWQAAFRLRRDEKIEAMKAELNDFRYVLGKAMVDGVTSKELAPLELSPEDLVKVAKFLMEAEVAPNNEVLADRFRQALRVLIQHNMDFGTLLLGRPIVEQAEQAEQAEQSRDDEESNGSCS
jgi:hypothetical protein